MIFCYTIFKTLELKKNEIFMIYTIIAREEKFLPKTNPLHVVNLHPSLLRNETYTKVGEALCLEIRRKDSRNEA